MRIVTIWALSLLAVTRSSSVLDLCEVSELEQSLNCEQIRALNKRMERLVTLFGDLKPLTVLVQPEENAVSELSPFDGILIDLQAASLIASSDNNDEYLERLRMLAKGCSTQFLKAIFDRITARILGEISIAEKAVVAELREKALVAMTDDEKDVLNSQQDLDVLTQELAEVTSFFDNYVDRFRSIRSRLWNFKTSFFEGPFSPVEGFDEARSEILRLSQKLFECSDDEVEMNRQAVHDYFDTLLYEKKFNTRTVYNASIHAFLSYINRPDLKKEIFDIKKRIAEKETEIESLKKKSESSLDHYKYVEKITDTL